MIMNGNLLSMRIGGFLTIILIFFAKRLLSKQMITKFVVSNKYNIKMENDVKQLMEFIVHQRM